MTSETEPLQGKQNAPDESQYVLSAADEKRLEELLGYVREQVDTFVGYPCRAGFDYSALEPFFHYPINNLGDPFAPCTYRVHTRQIEREVLAWFAELTHIPEGDYWGYSTSGGT
ncbi:MAG: hypothetical protein GY953_14170, partial [bacterium]|nr:hypothetical protein [bacterium]